MTVFLAGLGFVLLFAAAHKTDTIEQRNDCRLVWVSGIVLIVVAALR